MAQAAASLSSRACSGWHTHELAARALDLRNSVVDTLSGCRRLHAVCGRRSTARGRSRLVFRSRFLLLLMIALANLGLSSARPQRWIERLASAIVVLAPVPLTAAFFLDPGRGVHGSALTVFTMRTRFSQPCSWRSHTGLAVRIDGVLESRTMLTKTEDSRLKNVTTPKLIFAWFVILAVAVAIYSLIH